MAFYPISATAAHLPCPTGSMPQLPLSRLSITLGVSLASLQDHALWWWFCQLLAHSIFDCWLLSVSTFRWTFPYFQLSVWTPVEFRNSLRRCNSFMLLAEIQPDVLCLSAFFVRRIWHFSSIACKKLESIYSRSQLTIVSSSADFSPVLYSNGAVRQIRGCATQAALMPNIAYSAVSSGLF